MFSHGQKYTTLLLMLTNLSNLNGLHAGCDHVHRCHQSLSSFRNSHLTSCELGLDEFQSGISTNGRDAI